MSITYIDGEGLALITKSIFNYSDYFRDSPASHAMLRSIEIRIIKCINQLSMYDDWLVFIDNFDKLLLDIGVIDQDYITESYNLVFKCYEDLTNIHRMPYCITKLKGGTYLIT